MVRKVQDRKSPTEFLERVAMEVEAAKGKFPSPFGVMCALTEEVGEAARACLDESTDRVYDECVQVAAMALRLATEGDSSLNRYRRGTGVNPFPA